MIRPKNGIESDTFVYKLLDTNEDLPARNREYLFNVAKLIHYPQSEEVTDTMIRNSKEPIVKKGEIDLSSLSKWQHFQK